MSESMTDSEIVEALRKGDESAVRALNQLSPSGEGAV